MPRLLLVLSLLEALTWIALPAHAATKSREKVLGEPREDQALVYLIRDKHFSGSARTMFLYTDRSFLGVLENNSYTFAYLAPGRHLFWLNWAGERVSEEVELVGGEIYYFNIWHRFDHVDHEFGQALVAKVEFYTTPEEKEVATSAKHIRKRYGEIQELAEKKQGLADTEGKQARRIKKWPQVDLGPFTILFIEDFEMSDPKAGTRKKAYLVESVPRRIPDEIADARGEGVFDAVRRGTMAEPVDGAVILRGEITQYKPGSDKARAFAPVGGPGSAHLDFTAQLIDATSGSELSRFSGKRTWAVPGAEGLSRGIEDLEHDVAYEISVYLRRCKTGEEGPDC